MNTEWEWQHDKMDGDIKSSWGNEVISIVSNYNHAPNIKIRNFIKHLKSCSYWTVPENYSLCQALSDSGDNQVTHLAKFIDALNFILVWRTDSQNTKMRSFKTKKQDMKTVHSKVLMSYKIVYLHMRYKW